MKSSHWSVRGIFFFLCIFTAAAYIQAGIVQKLSFEQLVGEADLIVKGRVEKLDTRQGRDPRSITTLVTVSVERQFKGAKFSVVTIELPGGAAGEVSLGVPGLPEFSTGENVILFLKRKRQDHFNVVGGKQGKFTVRVDPASKNPVIEDFAHRTEAQESYLERLTKMTQNK